MELRELLNDHYLYHSQLQQDHFITARAGGTIYGQYKQALRELYKRIRGMRQIITDYDMAMVDIEELEVQSGEVSDRDRFDLARIEINIRQKTMLLEELTRTKEETLREAKRFYEQAVHLKGIVGELTPKKRHEYEKEMWEYYFLLNSHIDYISVGRPRPATIEMLFALPSDMRNKMEILIKNPAMLEIYIKARVDDLTKVMEEVKPLALPESLSNPFLLDTGDLS